MKKALFVIAALSLSGPIFAASCADDQEEMYDQLENYGSITTQNGFKLRRVFAYDNDFDGVCGAWCTSYFHNYYCSWQKGSWANTLMAK